MSGFIETIEKLSKNQSLRNGSSIEFAENVLRESLNALNCGRANAWLFNKDKTELNSICAITKASNQVSVEQSLKGSQMPKYFSHLKRNEIIVSDCARQEPMNEELVDSYLTPNNITAMIDVPLRSDGDMIGVICFEHVGIEHSWVQEEKFFAQSVAHLLSLSLETERKHNYRLELERLLNQKQVLLSEINHRVKNNLAIILSLLNIQKYKAKDEEHYGLFQEVRDKVFSMSILQQQLHSSERVDQIDLGIYVKSLVENLQTSYNQDKEIKLEINSCDIELDVSRAIPIGLIANEVLTNSYKYAFGKENIFPSLKIDLKRVENLAEIVFSDNGPGFSLDENNEGMGLELVKDLVEQIDAELEISSSVGTSIAVKFELHEI